MTDSPDGRARRAAPDAAARRAERERQHQVLADLLGAYADGELPAESAARVEAHLVGCGRCRGDLAMQAALRDRLAAEPVQPAGAALRARIAAAVAASEPAAVAADVAPPAAAPPATWRGVRVGVAALLVAVLAIAWAGWRGVRTGVMGGPAAAAPGAAPPAAELRAAARVPLVAWVLADYERVAARDLPGRARDLDAVRAATGLAVEPLAAPELHLLGAWITEVDDEVAAVLAYRRGDRLVLHYIVPESLYFRHAVLRAASAAGRPFAGANGARAVVAWAEAAAGVLLVSDDTEPSGLLDMAPATAGRAGSRRGS